MNLVQINERLKDLPTQVIQQYANGMNPEIPPYLALGELQRRETAQKQMATAQGAAQGPLPSIKEQVEQKAGLMAARGLQQQQMMDQMAQQRVPGPVPAGMPQPEDQPEAQPTMMARGGLARAPVNFNFQTGGIVAFDEGGETDKYETPYDRMNRKNRGELTKEERQKQDALEALIAQIPRDTNTVKGGERVSGNELSRNVGNTAMALPGASAARALSGSAGAGRGVVAGLAALTGNDQVAPSAAPAARPAAPPVSDRRLLNQADAALRSAPATPAAPVADLKALADQQRRQQAPRPAPPAEKPVVQQQQVQPDPNSMDAMFRAQLNKAPKERTVEEIQAEQRAIREGAGLTEPAGLAQLERIRKLQEQYEGSKPTPFQNLIRVLGQSAQYKGMSGMAPAYTANLDQQRAADLAMAKQINEMMSGVETTQRGEMKDIATGTSTARGTDRAAGVDFTKNLLSTLNTARGNDLTAAANEAQRKTQERGQDIQLQVAKIQSSAMQAARAQGADDKTIAAAEAAFARDPEAKALAETLKMFALNPNSPNYQSALQKLQAIQASKYRQFGIKLEGAPGAASPGGTPPDIQALLKQYPGGK
jgi:hypothetical protein